MPLDMNELFAANFSISTVAAEKARKLKRDLGFDHNYEIARLAMGLSLGQECYPDKMGAGSSGSIRGNILFGKDDYPLWVGVLLTNYLQFHPDDEDSISISLLQAVVRAHWDNGVRIMADLWEQCDEDENKFWIKLVRSYADLPDVVQHEVSDSGTFSPSCSSGAVRLVLGHILRKNGETGDEFVHEVNGAGYAPHIAIMGQAGSGKTRVMTHILQQMKKQAQCPAILVDLGKGDLGGNNALIQSLGATVLSVPEQPIPLDMFHVADMSDTNLTTAAMENFRDAFAQVAGKLGPKQSDNIAEALLPLFRTQQRITFQKIKETVDTFYADNGLSKDSVVSTVNSLTLRELFRPELSPDEFFRKSWVITFANARTEVKTFAVCLLLSALDFYFKRQPEAALDADGYRSLQLVLAIDEARELLGMNHVGLANNIRLHRSKGLSVILVSQSPDDYDGKKDDYLENIGLPLCLKTNAASPRSLKNMFKGDVNFASLQPGTCYSVDARASRPVLLKLQFDN